MTDSGPDIRAGEITKTELRTSAREYDRFISNVIDKHGKKRTILGIEAGRAMWLWSELYEMGVTPEEAIALIKYQREMGSVRQEIDELCSELQSAVRETRANLDGVVSTGTADVSDSSEPVEGD